MLCACDDWYLPHMATMLCSLVQHNAAVRIHLLHSKVNSRELAKIKYMTARYGSTVISYDITSRVFQGVRVDGHASIANYYRLLAPQVLPLNIDKALYLDSDIIVRRSLTDLWNVDLADHALAAVEDRVESLARELGLPLGAKYFNSGVLLMNLSYWRKHKIQERAIAFIKNNPLKVQYWDQDALNAILVNCWKQVPDTWNWNEQYVLRPGCALADPAIVHFCGIVKPWHWKCQHPFKHEYHQQRLKTPWRRYRLEGQPSLPRRLRLSLRSFAGSFWPLP